MVAVVSLEVGCGGRVSLEKLVCIRSISTRAGGAILMCLLFSEKRIAVFSNAFSGSSFIMQGHQQKVSNIHQVVGITYQCNYSNCLL